MKPTDRVAVALTAVSMSAVLLHFVSIMVLALLGQPELATAAVNVMNSVLVWELGGMTLGLVWLAILGPSIKKETL